MRISPVLVPPGGSRRRAAEHRHFGSNLDRRLSSDRESRRAAVLPIRVPTLTGGRNRWHWQGGAVRLADQ